MEKKLNCWEFKKCGREEGGRKASELGICAASIEKRLHGAHDGEAAGRTCWAVCGTLCEGKVQGTFAQKFANCEQCDFYSTVKSEEYPRFQMAAVLRAKLRDS